MSKKKRPDGMKAIASNRVLWAAWSRVAAGTKVPGVDGVTTERFGSQLDRNLAELQQHLLRGTYQAQPLKPMTVNRNGKLRPLGIATVRDRVAQRCFLEVFERELDAIAAESSFAYRKGRSWLDALKQVERYRDGGRRWVYRADIANFFEEIRHPVLESILNDTLHDARATRLAMAWVSAPLLGPNGIVERRQGVPQGAPVSPALANLYLTRFDRLAAKRGGVVRYADDLVVCCEDAASAEGARFDIEQALRPLELTVNHTKSYVSHFDTGFSFLGWVFFRDNGHEAGTHEGWTHPMSVGRPQRRGRVAPGHTQPDDDHSPAADEPLFSRRSDQLGAASQFGTPFTPRRRRT